MLDALKFVQGAVAKKDFIPALTHFRIKDRYIKGFNGSLALCSPIGIDLDIAPNAKQLVKAISACAEEISLHQDAKGKLVIRSGSFKSFVDCDDVSNFPDIRPEGQFVQLHKNFITALRYLHPFIATNDSRPWACGILFEGESAFAANGIVLIQYWLEFNFPARVNIPESAVRELIRIGESPIRLQVTQTRLVFHYSDGRWLSTQLFDSEWPQASAILDKTGQAATLAALPAGFFEALEQLAPFVEKPSGACFLQGKRIATANSSDAAGSSVEISLPAKTGIYKLEELLKLREIVHMFDFSAYPRPVPFAGEKCRGILLGISL